MEILYQEEKLDAIIAFFVEAYEAKPGKAIIGHDYYFKDNKVLIKLIVEDKKLNST